MNDLVLFLGAGASWHCGFPLGGELLSKVHQASEAEGNHRLVNTIGWQERWDPKPEEQLGIIRAHAWKSGFFSIDRFIQERPDVEKAAKLIVARLLRDSERASNVDRHAKTNWYDYLWNWAADGVKAGQRVAYIITLNYDRSLEEFAIRRCISAFGYERAKATSHVRNALPILHLHGTLGSLDEVPYAKLADDDEWIDAAIAARSIRTLGEAAGDE